MPGYPVFTRKPNTDVSYLACARKLLDATATAFYPAVRHAQRAHDRRGASHSPATAARSNSSACTAWATALYAEVIGRSKHERALPRLRAGRLARGSACLPGAPPARERRQHLSSSTASSTSDVPIDELVADPVEIVRALRLDPAPAHPAAASISTRPERSNSMGVDSGERGDAAPRSPPTCAQPRKRAVRCRAARRRPAARWRRTRRSPRPPIAAASSALSPTPTRRRSSRRCERASRRPRRGTRCPPSSAPRSWSTRPICWKRACSEFIALARARSRQDDARRGRRSARGGRFLPLLRRAGAQA